MMYNQDLILSYVLDFAMNRNLKYEVHKFPSGAMMIDLWKGAGFYVIQIDDKKVGLSLIDHNMPEFTSIADEYYYDFESFKKRFDERLGFGR